MKDRRILATILGLVTVAGLLAGCSSGGVPPTPQGAVPQETTPPAAAPGQEAATTPGVVEQQPVPTVSAVDEGESSAPSTDTEENSTSSADPVTGPSEEPYALRSDDGVDVVYFMTSNPCSCMTEFGDAIQQSILTNFQTELQNGALRYFVIVSNAPDNMDYVEAFNAQPFDLFIVDYVNGKGTAVPSTDVWTVEGNDEAVMASVYQSVLSALEGHR